MVTAAVAKVASWLGFQKRYNFWLFVVLNGALFAFVVARLSYFDFYGIFCRPDGTIDASNNAAPGECFYLLRNPYMAGMVLHLATILPAAFLACFQFVPVIRYKLLNLHRTNGYIIIVFSVLSVVGAFIITRYTFGGGLDVQAAIGVLAILFLFSTFLAFYNIKKLQIEEHRAWMLRAWVYAGSVITTRFIMFAAAAAISSLGGFYMATPCDKIEWMMGSAEQTLVAFPKCASYVNGASSGNSTREQVAVLANWNGAAPEASAAYDATYGMAHWVALILHIVGAEVYTLTAGVDAATLENMIADNGRIMREPARQLLLQTGLLSASAAAADDDGGDTLAVAPRAEPFALLDHACGTGPVVAALLEAPDAGGVVPRSRVLCADFSAALLGALRQRIAARGWRGIETAVLDAQETDLPPASFSHITLNFAVHVIPAPARVLADAHRLLRPGGTLGFTVWAAGNAGLIRDLRHALTGFPFATPPLPDPFPVAVNGQTGWVTEAGLATELDRFNHATTTTTITSAGEEEKKETTPRLVDLELRTCRYTVRVDGPEHYLRMFAPMVQWAMENFWDEETRARARAGGLERHIVQRMREAHGDGGWDQDWTYIIATCKKPL